LFQVRSSRASIGATGKSKDYAIFSIGAISVRMEYTTIQVKGKLVKMPSVQIEGRTVVSRGKWLKVAAVVDEELLEGDTVVDPGLFVQQLKKSGLIADLFTFAQKVPDSAPKYTYRMKWDNAAVIPITTFSEWFEKRAEHDVRKAITRAKKLGVAVTVAEFNDAFVEGIRHIYDENPLRRGAPFTHYKKDFETVKKENSTYFNRSEYIGAFHNGELIGFIRMVYVGSVATTLQVISQKQHSSKKPTNALIAKAVEICEQKGISHFVYGSYIYNDPSSSLTEFKRRNGFEQMLLPRYYVPLTLKGSIALRLNLHHQMANRLPKPVLTGLRKLRAVWYSHKLSATTRAS
jgi:hypothetical protein